METNKKRDSVVICMRLSLIVICLVGVTICAFWYPFQVSLTAIGIPSGERVTPTDAQMIAYRVQLFFYWLVSIPCFVLLGFGWEVSSDIKKKAHFSKKTARRLRTSALILFADSITFLLAQPVFTLLKWNPFAPILAVVGVIGLIISFTLYLASRFVFKAAELKEENEGYI